MPDTRTISLRRMRDTDLAAINYVEDIRGMSVFDADGNLAGVVSRLFIDSDVRKIRLIELQPAEADRPDGGVILLPIDAIARISRGVVHLDRPQRKLVRGEARSLLDDERKVQALYHHYSLQPFWTYGYTYPPYPYYMQMDS